MENYQEEALRTVSTQFNEGEYIDGMVFDAIIRKRLKYAGAIDGLKKTLFYGKPVNDPHLWQEIMVDSQKSSGSTIAPEPTTIHGILGIDSESAELMELLLQENDIIPEKIIDECGDLLWYINLTLSSVGSNIPEAQRANIAKLRARFPDKFKSELAMNPDRVAESAAISSSI